MTLEATISLSEDPSKVAMALKKIVGEVEAATSSDPRSASLVTGDQRALVRLRDQLRDRHVRSAARKQLLANQAGDKTKIMLNRQAASVGTIAICGSPEESPLGPVYLTLESEKLTDVIDWVATYGEG